MKIRQLLGSTLILSSILLQVGYATTTTVSTINRTQVFDMSIAQVQIGEQSEQVEVTTRITSDGKGLHIKVSNLYPGASFSVRPEIKNQGNIDAKVTGIQVQQVGDITAQSARLYSYFQGYGADGQTYPSGEAYEDYLIDTYYAQIIQPGEEMILNFGMALDASLTDLQNQQIEFEMIFDFEQSGTHPPEPPEPPEPPDPPEPPEPPDPPIPPDPPGPDIDIPDPEIPGGNIPDPPGPEIDISEPEIPGGHIPDPPETDIDISDPEIPGGRIPAEKLPQTGGVTPTLVYTLGLAMLGSGLALYNKKQ